MTDGSDDGVSDTILDVGSIDGKELGFSLKEEVGDALGTCDSPTVGFNDGAEDGSLLGEALLLPSEDVSLRDGIQTAAQLRGVWLSIIRIMSIGP